jgi:transposase
MTAAYSLDLRRLAIKNYEEGILSQQEISDELGIHLSTFKRIYRYYRDTGKLELPKSNAGRPSLISESGYKKIQEYVSSTPSMLLEDIQNKYYEDNQVKLSLPTICRALQSLSLNRKKISHYAQEQDREDVKKKTTLSSRRLKTKS